MKPFPLKNSVSLKGKSRQFLLYRFHNKNLVFIRIFLNFTDQIIPLYKAIVEIEEQSINHNNRTATPSKWHESRSDIVSRKNANYMNGCYFLRINLLKIWSLDEIKQAT